MRRQNYLNNKDILKEIHKSKVSFCSFVDKKYSMYDAIVHDLNEITQELIDETKQKVLNKMIAVEKVELKTAGVKNPMPKSAELTIDDIPIEQLTFRLMTYEHIPLDSERRKNPKVTADNHTKLNFKPFKHYAYVNGELVEVGRSHWKGDFVTGEFDKTHGKITNTLANMFIELTEKIGRKLNWRNYTYLDEMRNQALLQLISAGLNFDESRGENPFAYYTTLVTHSFTGVVISEKKNQTIRDDILIMHGENPSITRQIDMEIESREDYARLDGTKKVII